MPSTVRALRVGLLALIAALLAAAPAPAQTTVTAEATVWPAPGDSAARVVSRIADPAGFPGLAQQLTVYLPAPVALDGSKLPTCALETVYSDQFVAGCSTGSQVGSGRAVALVGPMGAQLQLDVFLINGALPGQLIAAVAQVGGGVNSVLAGQVGPSDDPHFGSTVSFTVPHELRFPAPGIEAAVTELDLLLHAGPYVTVADCPLGVLPFKSVVTFDPAGSTVPPGPLQTNVAATCAAGAPPALLPMPRSATSPPDVVPVADETVVPQFGIRLQRVRRLKLTGVARDADVSVRCLRRCGRRGAELLAKRSGRTAKLKRALKPRARFELRVTQEGAVTRFTRYRVGARGRTVRRVGGGCLDAAGQARACPA